jgi:hypothetical protein
MTRRRGARITAPIIALALLIAALLTACGGGGKAAPIVAATHTVAASTPASSGPERFLADIRASYTGSKDFGGERAGKILLHIGRIICDGLSSDLDYADEISAVTQTDSDLTIHDSTVVDSAIRNLCPEYVNQMPEGAP